LEPEFDEAAVQNRRRNTSELHRGTLLELTGIRTPFSAIL